jgi:hypothetical protein
MIGPINTDGNSPGYIYSTSVADMGYLVVDHRGYLFAPHRWSIHHYNWTRRQHCGDWLGTYAYSDWTKANENLASEYYNIPTSTTITLSAAEWVAIRVLWVNTSGPGAFAIRITAPDSTELVGPDLASSPYLVQYSCDGSTAQQRDLGLEEWAVGVGTWELRGTSRV